MESVKLYVYDLSQGMAKQLSLQLTGRQIDGIWHTSVVVYGQEIFYGRGISITRPGHSHHGSPSQILDVGQTAIDKETLNEYLDSMREHYTADKYHLLDFNCNSFTNDFVGFLTGESIPDFIKELPTEFLSTPFGASLRPTIDAMYRPSPSPTPTPPVSTPIAPVPQADLASQLLQAVASQAQQNGAQPTPAAATASLTGSLFPCTNQASFNNIIRTHRAVVVNFSNIQTCPPCRMIAPIYENLAKEKGLKTGLGGQVVGAAFVKVDMSTPTGNQLAGSMGVRVMPTFFFYLDGKKIDEMKGADQQELRTQIDLLLYQAFPPHPHTSLSLPALGGMSLNPILFKQLPNFDAMITKFSGFIDTATWSPNAAQTATQVKQVLTTGAVPYLKGRFPADSAAKATPPALSGTLLAQLAQATTVLATTLPVECLFPVVDVWRLTILDPVAGTWAIGAVNGSNDPLSLLLSKTSTPAPRPYILTLLRLLSNIFSCPPLAKRFLARGSTLKASFTAFLVPSLLHTDASVRTAAASLAFNTAALIQSSRAAQVSGRPSDGFDEDEDWELELVSAVLEALDQEKENEDVVHRLAATLGFLLRLSPFHENVQPLLEVLQAKDKLNSKLAAGGCGAKGVAKKDVQKLVKEVAESLC